jgi:hypothetical protein
MIKGLGTKDILSGEEMKYVRSHPPENVIEYMQMYTEALKSKRRQPSRLQREAERKERERAEMSESV